jgi:hypothetical protein
MADRNIVNETEEFIYGNMEMHNLRIHQGGALQATEMPPVRRQGEVREGVVILTLQGLQPFRKIPDSCRGGYSTLLRLPTPCVMAAHDVSQHPVRVS